MGDEPNTRARVSTRSSTLDKSYQNDDIMQLFASDDEGSGIDLPESDPSLADKIINQCDYQTLDNESQPGSSTTGSISLKSKTPTRGKRKPVESKTGKKPVKKQKTNKDEDWRNKVDSMLESMQNAVLLLSNSADSARQYQNVHENQSNMMANASCSNHENHENLSCNNEQIRLFSDDENQSVQMSDDNDDDFFRELPKIF